MKRSVSIRFSLAAIAAITLPFILAAKLARYVRTARKGFLVGAGKDRNGRSMPPVDGDTLSAKLSTQDTDGGIYVFESTRIKKGGPSLHFHYEQDEWWYVLKGQFLIRVGEETFHARPGDSVFGPRGVPHAFTKMGEEEAKMLMFFQPAGKMEAFFKAAGEGRLQSMTEAERDAFRKAHGFERVGPAMEHLKV